MRLFARARRMGIAKPQFGAVAFTQRFSSRLMLYPHVHCVIPDGVFVEGDDGKLVFHELRPTDEDVEKIAKRIVKKSRKLLAGLEEIDPDALDQVRGQAVQGELALKIVPVEAAEEVKGRLRANIHGFSLQAQRRLHQSDRAGLEFLLRYVLRPPFALERMRQLPSGKIELGLKRPLANGTAAIELRPLSLLRRLASIVPPPGAHDTTYFGVFAAHSKWRRRLVRPREKAPEDCRTHPGLEERDGPVVEVSPESGSPPDAEEADEAYIPWAKLMKRVFGLDVLRCECGGRMVVKQYVTDEEKIRKNLERLGLWKDPPQVAKARDPEQVDQLDPPSFCDGVDPPAPDDVA